MKVKDLTVEVKAKLTVDEGTANACLKFVELFVNETGKNIVFSKEESGKVSLHFEETGA